jgi:hypothetical protein
LGSVEAQRSVCLDGDSVPLPNFKHANVATAAKDIRDEMVDRSASLFAAALLGFDTVRHMDWKTAAGMQTEKLVWAVVAVTVAIGLFFRSLKFFKHYAEEVFRDDAEPAET